MRFVWPGFMMLMGHVVDVIEWLTVILFANWADGHYVTHSPFVTIGFVAVICGLVALFSGLRRPWPYLLIAVAVFSHLAMDAGWGRKFLADLYGVTPEGLEGYSLGETILAECWLYGLLLLLVLLARGAIGSAARPSRTSSLKPQASGLVQRRPPRMGRMIAGLLAAMAIFAAGTRIAAFWIPIYALGFLHAGLLLRRELDPRMAWGGLFLIPLAVCVVSEVHASNLTHDAWSHQMDNDFRTAIQLYHKSLAYPQRASPVMTLAHIGQCYDALGEPAEAEAFFKRAMSASEEPGWGHYWLAWFYANRNWQATPYYRPEESARILQAIVAGSKREAVKTTAENLLMDIARR